MAEKYMLYVEDYNTENNMEIECNDKDELIHYAAECIRKGYKSIRAETEVSEDC